MKRNFKYFLSLLPNKLCGVFNNKFDFWFDDYLKDLVRAECGELNFLVSAGFSEKYRNRRFKKSGEFVMVDSGGFQYYGLTRGKMHEFLNKREDFYNFQLQVGDLIVGGDMPTGKEVSFDELAQKAYLTKDNMELQFKLGVTPEKFINVIHGVSPKALDIWYSQVGQFKNVGWAVAAKSKGVSGNIMQILYLLEKGELTEGKYLHLFAMSGVKSLWSMFYVLDRLNLWDKIKLTSDSSSFALGRFGCIFYEGERLLYEDIRKAGKVITLCNGTVVDYIPKKLERGIAYYYILTGMQHFLRWVYTGIMGQYEREIDVPGSQVRKAIQGCGIDKILNAYRMGGVEAAWAYAQDDIEELGNTKLINRFFE